MNNPKNPFVREVKKYKVQRAYYWGQQRLGYPCNHFLLYWQSWMGHSPPDTFMHIWPRSGYWPTLDHRREAKKAKNHKKRGGGVGGDLKRQKSKQWFAPSGTFMHIWPRSVYWPTLDHDMKPLSERDTQFCVQTNADRLTECHFWHVLVGCYFYKWNLFCSNPKIVTHHMLTCWRRCDGNACLYS